MKEYIIVVDEQNDFITGSLGSPAAERAYMNTIDFLKNKPDAEIIFTQDTHDDIYLRTLEGVKLPVTHCEVGTEGWAIGQELVDIAKDREGSQSILKNTFGSFDLVEIMAKKLNQEIYGYVWDRDTIDIASMPVIYICGLCTDICVISNAMLLRAAFPNHEIKIVQNCCAGTSPEAHEGALLAMKSCQMDIIYG